MEESTKEMLVEQSLKVKFLRWLEEEEGRMEKGKDCLADYSVIQTSGS